MPLPTASDLVSLYYVAEVTPGVTPSNPTLSEIRCFSPQVTFSPRHVETGELNPDRQAYNLVRIGTDVGAEIGTEWFYANADDWIEAAFCSSFTPVAAQVAPTAIASTSITVASGQGTRFKKGMLLRGAGNAEAGNNGLFKLGADGTSTSLTITGGTTETPPAAARFHVRGFECASGDAATQTGPARLVITSTSGDFSGLGLLVGDWVGVGVGASATNQFATAACNGFCRISAISATTLTFDVVPEGWSADAGTGKAIRLSLGRRLRPGTTRRTFTLQRRLPDVTSGTVYENTTMQEIAAMRIELRSEDLARLYFTFMGSKGDLTTTQFSGATDVTRNATFEPMNTTDDMVRLDFDLAGWGTMAGQNYVQSMDMTFGNNLRQRPALANFNSVPKGLGRFRVDGRADVYFGDRAIYDKVVNTDADVQSSFVITDGLRGYVVDLPALRGNGSANVGGADSDLMMPITYRSRRHPTLGYSAQVVQFQEFV